MLVPKGTINQSVTIRIVDSTDGTPELGVLYNTAGIDMEYRREGAASVDITEVTLAALTTAHTDGGFLEIGNGYYRLDVPDAAFATGVDGVLIHGTVTGMVVMGVYVQLTNVDLFDGVRAGLTALPNAAADGVGGLPVSDAGGLDLDTKLANTNEITVARMGALTDWIDGGRLDLLIDALTTHLTDIKGGTFNGATDSLEAIRNQGDVGWATADLSALATAVQVDGLNNFDPVTEAVILAAAQGPVTFTGTSGSAGLTLQGEGAGPGLKNIGGATGHGQENLGGATSGDGVHNAAQGGGNGSDNVGVGANAGTRHEGGATGPGIHAHGGATSGAGCEFHGHGATANGLELEVDGSGAPLLGVLSPANIPEVGAVTGHTPQTADHAASIAAILADTGAGIPALIAALIDFDPAADTVANVAAVASVTALTSAERNAIADALLKRDWTAVSGEAARCVLNALRFLRNKWAITGAVNPRTLTIYKEDDATAAWTSSANTAAGDPMSDSDPT